MMTEIVEYPLLVYNSYMPDRSELVITNMAEKSKNSHVIKLNGLSFIAFINSTLWPIEVGDTDSDVKEDDSIVFFLAWDNNKHEYCVMMLSCDPWL